MHTLSSTSSESDRTARSKLSVRTWRSISRSSGDQTWYFATRVNYCLLHWSSLRPCSPRSVASSFKISTTLLQICTLRRTLSCSRGKESSAMITSTFSRGSMNSHYFHEKPSTISSEAWSGTSGQRTHPARVG